MPTSTRKKVIVRHGRPEPDSAGIRGFFDPSELRLDEPVTFVRPDGNTVSLAWPEILAVYFVHEFVPLDALAGARGWGRKGAQLPGFWVRVHGRDGFHVDGVLATGLLELSQGIWLSPLYGGGVCQRVFVPATAARRLEPLALVRPRRRAPARRPPEGQFDLFDAAHRGPNEGDDQGDMA